MTGAGLPTIAKSPPGPSFSQLHAQLTCWQSTLLSQLRTGICDLGAYRTHFNPDKELCKCSKVESRELFPPPLPSLRRSLQRPPLGSPQAQPPNRRSLARLSSSI